MTINRRAVGVPAVMAGAAAVLAVAATSAASAYEPPDPATAPMTFALIGDTPYGPEQAKRFPDLRADINADPAVRMVLHAGDIKDGSSPCDDQLFAERRALYDGFEDPFLLTPGDNEWTDCHRESAGSYLPTERLDAVREVFYPEPGRTIGGRQMPVRSQAGDPEHSAYVENVRFTRAGVVFATVHVVGSRDDLEPWSGLPGGDRPEVRLAEFEAREAAALSWIDGAFEAAEQEDAAGVLLMLQAEPVAGEPGFARVRERILERTADFDGPVLLVHGDEHVFEDQPNYAGVPNLTRLETFGETAEHWLRVQVDPSADRVFRWEPVTVP